MIQEMEMTPVAMPERDFEIEDELTRRLVANKDTAVQMEKQIRQLSMDTQTAIEFGDDRQPAPASWRVNNQTNPFTNTKTKHDFAHRHYRDDENGDSRRDQGRDQGRGHGRGHGHGHQLTVRDELREHPRARISTTASSSIGAATATTIRKPPAPFYSSSAPPTAAAQHHRRHSALAPRREQQNQDYVSSQKSTQQWAQKLNADLAEQYKQNQYRGRGIPI
jgi:hypothetical protein